MDQSIKRTPSHQVVARDMIALNEEDEQSGKSQDKEVLVILTLKKHVDGIWITRLVQRLKESAPNFPASRTIEIRIRTLEDWLAEGWLISEESKGDPGIIGIVNRVSDAASPALFKACCALLAAAEESLNIPVWNGSKAYSLCGNKWRHHLLFRQAKLSAPTTMVYYTGHNGIDGERQQSNEKTIHIDASLFQRNDSGRIEVLVKPNAGGFGAGIKKVSSAQTSSSNEAERTAEVSIPSSFEDDMALVQQYEIPSDGNIYRVWFLNGKIQCAVRRLVNSRAETNENRKDESSSRSEFTSGCAGGNMCKLSVPLNTSNTATGNNNDNDGTAASEKPQSLALASSTTNLIPWEVPEEVRNEIENQLLPLLIDAHCGSVEFLYSSSSIPEIENNEHSCIGGDVGSRGKSETQAGEFRRRLYFDLNLLSTLPILENMDINHDTAAGDAMWPEDFDPWLDLAHNIWDFFVTAK